jgi:hypothetical protein
MKLHRHRIIGIFQILQAYGEQTLQGLVGHFKDHGVDVGTGAHLETLLTPMTHLGLVDRTRRQTFSFYSLTQKGRELLVGR